MIWIVVALVVIGAGLMVYMLAGNQSSVSTTEEPDTPPSAQEQASVSGAAEVEQELEAIEIEGLDAELGDIEKEIFQ